MMVQWSRPTRMRAVLCLVYVRLFKGADGGAVVLRGASEEGEVFFLWLAAMTFFNAVFGFDPVCNGGG